MSFPKRHRRAILISGFLLIALTILSLFHRTASEIAHPPRRALQDYHRGFLDHPERHGFHISSFTASDGTPVLVCTPSANDPPGLRGLTIRSQLESGGVAIPAVGDCIGTLVLLHGRRGRKEDYLPIAERLCAVGFRCILPDLPAHGDHPGKTATFGIRESGIPQLILTEAATRFRFPAQPAGLLGMSMGGSVAVHAAALPDAPWKALVVISSFDSLAPAVEGQAAARVGSTFGRLFVRSAASIYQSQTGIPLESIRPTRHAATLELPTLIAHGTADPVVPAGSGRRLFDSLLSEDKSWIEIPDAGHDNVLITPFPIYRAIAAWMLVHVPDAPPVNR